MLVEKYRQKEPFVYHPEIVILPTSYDVDKYAATKFIEQVRSKPNSVLTLPTGSTPEGMYGLLVQTHKESGLDLSQLTTFNLDEYWQLPSDHSASYASYMQRNLFQHVNIPVTQRHIPNSEAPDPNIEAAHYEEMLTKQQVDLAILGIGPGTTCHIGFNGRGSAIDSRTRYMPLDEQTLHVNAQSFPNPNEIPRGSITQGIGNILEAKKIMLLAKGVDKAWGIQRTLEGPKGSEAPASFLRFHPRVTFVLDQAAAQLLYKKTSGN